MTDFATAPPFELDVCIEVPRGGFVKRGHGGRIVLLSPLPCPYNYGAAPAWLGLEGDLLDAVVLGPRLPRGSEVRVNAYAAIGMTDHGQYDDKLICARQPPSDAQMRALLRFFAAFAFAKRQLNRLLARRGPTRCEGWVSATDAMSRARPNARRPRVGRTQ